MNNFKSYILPSVLIILCSVLISLNLRTCNSKIELEDYIAQEELATKSEIDSLKESVISRERTIRALEEANDSISIAMVEVVKQLNIQKSKLKSVSLIGSKATKTDTIVFRDTIFNKDFSVDTTLYDNWYKLDLSLSYPSRVVVTPTFRSEKYIVSSYKKEYINKPSPIFFIRWFQRKHTVLKVDVVEKSPYMEVDTLRHIEIIK